jgi:hypothetical protein
MPRKQPVPRSRSKRILSISSARATVASAEYASGMVASGSARYRLNS